MRLYPKKLRNLNDLEKEKKKLVKEAKQLNKEDMLSFVPAGGRKSKDTDSSSLLDLLPIDNPLIKTAVSFIGKRLLKTSEVKAAKKSVIAVAIPAEKKGKGKQVLKKAAIEFIGGYLKWKAIELSYKGIKLVVKKTKENSARKKMERLVD